MKITAFSVIMKVFQSRKWFMQGVKNEAEKYADRSEGYRAIQSVL